MLAWVRHDDLATVSGDDDDGNGAVQVPEIDGTLFEHEVETELILDDASATLSRVDGGFRIGSHFLFRRCMMTAGGPIIQQIRFVWCRFRHTP